MTVEKREKCLLILSKPPYPAIGGDRVKNFHIIKILNRHYDLSLLIITDEVINEEAERFLKDNSGSYKIFYYSKWRFYLKALLGIFSREPIQVSYYYFREVKRYVDGIIDKADVVICNLIRTAKYVNTDKRKILDINDSLALNYQRSITRVTSLFWKTIYRLEVNRLFAFEKKCIARFDATIFVNESESEYWAKEGNVKYLPFSIDDNLFDYKGYDPQYADAVTFFGKMDYQPNIDAVMWFVKNVLSLLDPGITFIVVGARPTNEILNLPLTYANVKVTGFIEDPYLVISSGFLSVAPMQTGAGLQNKILEVMALGKVILSNALAAGPIKQVENNKHILLAETASEMAAIINDVYRNRSGYEQIGRNAKELMSQFYTRQRYEDALLGILDPQSSKS